MSIVTDFKSIKRKLNRMEQKAEFEEKNPKVELSMYGYPSNLTVPFKTFIIDGWLTHVLDVPLESTPNSVNG